MRARKNLNLAHEAQQAEHDEADQTGPRLIILFPVPLVLEYFMQVDDDEVNVAAAEEGLRACDREVHRSGAPDSEASVANV